jgi:hypothetical protein
VELTSKTPGGASRPFFSLIDLIRKETTMTGQIHMLPPRGVRRRAPRAVEIAPLTGPFDGLSARAPTLFMADVENLRYGARDLSRRIDFQALAQVLRRRIALVELHACFSSSLKTAEDGVLTAAGWTVHRRAIIDNPAAGRRSANADVSLAFHVAALIGKLQPQACILGSGDGELVLDIARAIRAQFPVCRTIATASLAGSTSWLLDARREKLIGQNIEIGLDAMTQRRAAS